MRAPALALLLAALSAALPAAAAEKPSFDCAKADGAAEDLVCSDAALAALDRRLAATYAAAVEALKSVDAGGEEALAELKAVQRGWIKGRNDCWKAEDLRACVEGEYLRREAELVAKFMLEEPRPPVRYVCGGNEADEFYAYFFETELPSARLERGDGIAAVTQIRSGSGARYGGAKGIELWIKGDEATLTWPFGEEHACKVAD